MSSGSLFESLPSEQPHFGRCFISPLMESPRPREVHRAFTYGTGVGSQPAELACEDAGSLCHNFGCLGSAQPQSMVVLRSFGNPYWGSSYEQADPLVYLIFNLSEATL